MLDAMRRQATGWVVKGFLVLLVVSFAIWGIGDIFRGRATPDAVARVGGEAVRPEEVVRDTERSFRVLREQLGGQLERSPPVMESLLRQALGQSVARRLVDLHARDLALAVDPATLARMVREDPAFQGPGGFDRQRFERVIRELGLGEAGYVERLRGDVLRGRLVDAVSGAVAAPDTLARELARHRAERRRGRALVVPAAAERPPAPEPAELEAWLEANAAAFTVPELRAVELVVLGVEDLLEESAPDEPALRAAYAERRDALTTPEQRTALQLLAPDRATAEEAARLVAEGWSLAEVATALEGRGVTVATLGPVEPALLPPPLDGVLAGLAPGATSEPVQSPFGWHLLRLEAVTPAVVRPFEEVRAGLALELARQRALDRLPEVSERLDDALAAGEPLARAAAAVGARHLVLPAVDPSGRDAEGRPLEGIQLSPEMLQEIATTEAGRTSLVVHGRDDRYFVVRVERLTPARPRRLEEVRAAVEAGWRLDRQRELARTRAAGLATRAAGGADLLDLARENPGLALVELGPLRRRGDPSPLGPEVVAALFATEPGRTAAEPVPTADGAAVVATLEVLPAAAAELDLETVRRELASGLGEALLVGYEQALRRRFPVETDGRALARLLDGLGR